MPVIFRKLENNSRVCNPLSSRNFTTARAVRQHVQSCFNHEAELVPLIEAATTQAELDAIVW